ncbi:hypothetical protein BVX93_01350 [bacterium B13(2017)]|nr:hypothetical protein BVX93_01350 [bacterium B13(2017)]
MQLLALFKKETLLILRDKLHLLVLFLMPVLFITTLSLALKDAYDERKEHGVKIYLSNLDEGELGKKIVKELIDNNAFEINQNEINKEKIKIIIPKNLTGIYKQKVDLYLDGDDNSSIILPDIELFFDPIINIGIKSAIIQAIQFTVLKNSVKTIFENISGEEENFNNKLPIEIKPLNSKGKNIIIPSAVQQNVPAWTIFAMFFIVLPLSASLCSEKNMLTLMRLQTMPISKSTLLVGKLIPYIILNFLQFFIMLFVGIYLIPLLGGDKLLIGNSYVSMMGLGLLCAVATTAFGLMISVFCKTQSQANAFAPSCILIMAGFGGILVPKLIMPLFMQNLSNFSPMQWMLNGFLDIYLKNANLIDIYPDLLKIFLFSLFCFTISIFKLYK